MWACSTNCRSIILEIHVQKAKGREEKETTIRSSRRHESKSFTSHSRKGSLVLVKEKGRKHAECETYSFWESRNIVRLLQKQLRLSDDVGLSCLAYYLLRRLLEASFDVIICGREIHFAEHAGGSGVDWKCSAL